jgi:hypothetical protein
MLTPSWFRPKKVAWKVHPALRSARSAVPASVSPLSPLRRAKVSLRRDAEAPGRRARRTPRTRSSTGRRSLSLPYRTRQSSDVRSLRRRGAM